MDLVFLLSLCTLKLSRCSSRSFWWQFSLQGTLTTVCIGGNLWPGPLIPPFHGPSPGEKWCAPCHTLPVQGREIDGPVQSYIIAWTLTFWEVLKLLWSQWDPGSTSVSLTTRQQDKVWRGASWQLPPVSACCCRSSEKRQLQPPWE